MNMENLEKRTKKHQQHAEQKGNMIKQKHATNTKQTHIGTHKCESNMFKHKNIKTTRKIIKTRRQQKNIHKTSTHKTWTDMHVK